MCGDGANDCGALQAAHAGISLSEAESSVAAPFTSREANITCVPTIIRDGRAALSTAFGIFKFMIVYSLTEFLSGIILYSIDCTLTDLEFIYIDIFLIVNFAFLFGKTEAFTGTLVKNPPLTRLISIITMISICLQMIVNISLRIASFKIVHYFPWFKPFNPVSLTGYACYENYSVFCVSMFQYISIAIIFSEGWPYRKPVYTNIPLMCSVTLMTVICTYITVYPASWVQNILELEITPGYEFRLIVVALGICGFISGMILESFVINYIFMGKLGNMIFENKTKYDKIEEETHSDPNWPPLTIHKPYVSPTLTAELPPEVITDIRMHICNENKGVDNKAFVEDDDVTTKL